MMMWYRAGAFRCVKLYWIRISFRRGVESENWPSCSLNCRWSRTIKNKRPRSPQSRAGMGAVRTREPARTGTTSPRHLPPPPRSSACSVHPHRRYSRGARGPERSSEEEAAGEMISQFFVLSQRGDHIVFRDCEIWIDFCWFGVIWR
jgi:hypothetical protein